MNRLIIVIVFLTSGIWSCNRHVVPPLVVPEKDSSDHKSGIIQTEKENRLKPDSALFNALIKCDSTGKAYVAIINQLQGERVNQSINQNSQGKDLEIEIKAKDNAKEKIKVTVLWDTLYIYKQKPIPYKVEVPVNYVSGWQWFQIWLGRILAITLIAINIYRMYRDRFKSLLNRIKTIFN